MCCVTFKIGRKVDKWEIWYVCSENCCVTSFKGNILDTPITAKESETFSSHLGIEVGSSGMQGWRMEMEDAHVAVDIPSQLDHLFLAVFDGHAGAGAAVFAASNIVPELENTKEWKEYVAGGAANAELLGEALGNAFMKVDEKLKEHQESTFGKDTSGCTAVTAIVTPTFIICANAGDSRCVLGTNGSAVALSDDHKPYGEIEKKRIEAAGGFVQWNRVDGDLAVSRALGDFSYKHRPDLQAKDQKVCTAACLDVMSQITCFPDIRVHTRTAEDDILLLACDGLWDVMTTPEAVDTAREIFSSGEVQVERVAEEMLDIALDKGSKDNISVVAAKLPGCAVGPEAGGGVEARRKKRQESRQMQESEATTN